MHPARLEFANGSSIELIERDGEFLGLGSVRVNGTVLRSGERPMFVEIRNPWGVELCHYKISARKDTAEGARLSFRMARREGGPMEWMVHEVRARVNTSDWSVGPVPAGDTTLEMELLPVTRCVGGREYTGFSYRYHFRSRSLPIYKILDRATWEIGGSILGNELWLRNCFVPSIQAFESAEQFHSTEWYIPDCANPSALQFMTLQTEFQGFSFTAAPAGVLVTWVPEVAHVRSLWEKPRGATVLAHLHEHCGDLSREFSTAPMEVLWSSGGRDRVGLINDHEAWRELVYDTLHAKAGLRREYVSTYGMIEEWTPADLEKYRVRGLPKLLGAGMKTIYLANHFQNNMNTWGVSNFCCTVDYKVAESVGEERLGAFCRDARAGGAHVEMWGNTAISTLNLIFDKRQGASDRLRFLPREDSIMAALDLNRSFVRNASNAIDADHYTPVFAVLNLRDPAVVDYWLKRWKDAHNRIGLGGIFLDSSCNLSSDKFHYIQNTGAHLAGATSDQGHLLGVYRPAHEPEASIHSQYHAHLHLMAEMQRIGYVYCNEDIGVFGIHRHGPPLRARLDSLFLWSDCIASFEPGAIRDAGRDPGDVFFRGLAYRMMWALHWDPVKDELTFRYGGAHGPDDLPGPFHFALYRVFQTVREAMKGRRTVLPEERGVLYGGVDCGVLWACAAFTLPLERPVEVREVSSGNVVLAEGEFHAAARQVYLLRERK